MAAAPVLVVGSDEVVVPLVVVPVVDPVVEVEPLVVVEPPVVDVGVPVGWVGVVGLESGGAGAVVVVGTVVGSVCVCVVPGVVVVAVVVVVVVVAGVLDEVVVEVAVDVVGAVVVVDVVVAVLVVEWCTTALAWAPPGWCGDCWPWAATVEGFSE